MKQLFYNSSFFTLFFIALSCFTLIFCDWIKHSNTNTFTKIDGDGKDYYSYLTSAFITKDLTHLKAGTDFVVETPSGTINLHPAGVAVLQLPFFGLGYVFATINKQELNGFSSSFQLAISLAGVFYALLGLLFIYKTLIVLKFSKVITSITLLVIFFGTNLLNYTITEPSMSHIYSFALISAFIFYNQKLAFQFSTRYVYIIALLFGFIVLVRPVNALSIFLLPFFYNSFAEFKHHIKRFIQNKKTLSLSLLIVGVVYSIQCLIWFAQTGQFFQSSYKGNGFYFSDPKLFSMLFSFNSGIFIYTPLFFISALSLFFIYKINSFKAYSLILFLAFALYIFSSYWGWTYFDGLGTRTVVDYYAIAAIALAFVLNAVKTLKQQWSLGLIVALCVAFNLVICYQYKEGIIQTCGMNYDKFNYVFLKTSPQYKNVLGGCYDLMPYSKETKNSFISFENTYDSQKNHFYNYNKTEFGAEYKSPKLNIDSKKIHVKIGIDRFEIKPNATKDVLLALSLNDSNNNCKAWQTFKLNDTPAVLNYSNWKHYNYGVNMACTIKPTDQLSVFVWNKNKQQFGIDNFKIELFDYGHIN